MQLAGAMALKSAGPSMHYKPLFVVCGGLHLDVIEFPFAEHSQCCAGQCPGSQNKRGLFETAIRLGISESSRRT